MYNSGYQYKLLALLIGIIFALATVILLLLVNTPTPDYNAPAGMVEIAGNVPAACNALINALGGCK